MGQRCKCARVVLAVVLIYSVGVGQRKTKKAATSIASYEACIKLKIVKGRSRSEVTSKVSVARSPVKKTPYEETVLQGQEEGQEERKEHAPTKTAEQEVHEEGDQNKESEEKEEGEETAKEKVQVEETGASPIPSVMKKNEAGNLKQEAEV